MLEYSLTDGHKPYRADGRMCRSVRRLDNPILKGPCVQRYPKAKPSFDLVWQQLHTSN
jgi:hypothetical protein